jgi:CHASE2 domain-containing sensor protein/signal transduction histidine kinase
MKFGSAVKTKINASDDSGFKQPDNPYKSKFVLEWLIAISITLLLMTLTITSNITKPISGSIYDQIQAFFNDTPNNDIVIVAIDDRTINSLGGWPISRLNYAQLLKNLADTDNKPKAIGFDILFFDETKNDSAFIEQMRRHRVVLPFEIVSVATPDHPTQVHKPYENIALAASDFGQIEVTFDADGLVRRSLLISSGMPHFMLSMAGAKNAELSANEYRRFKLVDPATGFPTLSLVDLISNPYQLSLLKNKYVLVGATSISLGDRYATSYSVKTESGTPGIEINASLLKAIIEDKLIKDAPDVLVWLIGFISVMIVFIGLWFLTPTKELLFSISAVIVLIIFSALILRFVDVWIDPAPAIFSIILIKPIWAWRRMELITHFMGDKVAELSIGQRKEEGLIARSHSFIQASGLLDTAIHAATERIRFLSVAVNEIPQAVLVIDKFNKVVVFNHKVGYIFGDTINTGLDINVFFGQLDDTDKPELESALFEPYPAKRLSVLDKNQQAIQLDIRVVPLNLNQRDEWRLMLMVDMTEYINAQKLRDRNLATLSHDMRTPVASIFALCDDKTGSTAFSHIEQHCHQILTMLDDFILNIKAEYSDYRFEEILFESLLDDAIYQVKDLMTAEGMKVIQHSDDIPAFIKADNRLLVRVFVNLFVNAIRYGQFGSQIEINMQVLETDQSMQLVVSMSNVIANNAVSEDKPKITGFGIGMYFIDMVITKHGGQVAYDISNIPGETAKVTVTLPCVEE